MDHSGADDADAKIPVLNNIYAGLGAYSSMDFGYNVLIPNLQDEYSYLDPYNYGHWDTNGGLIIFTEGKLLKAFNVPDAGNFLFGAAANRMGLGLSQVLLGADLNEGGTDAGADQNAITAGYLHMNKIRAYHNSTYLGFGMFFNYEKSRPRWFKKDFSANVRLWNLPRRRTE